jgi:hypothetical protein
MLSITFNKQMAARLLIGRAFKHSLMDLEQLSCLQTLTLNFDARHRGIGGVDVAMNRI